jgi:hypothetical protein
MLHKDEYLRIIRRKNVRKDDMLCRGRNPLRFTAELFITDSKPERAFDIFCSTFMATAYVVIAIFFPIGLIGLTMDGVVPASNVTSATAERLFGEYYPEVSGWFLIPWMALGWLMWFFAVYQAPIAITGTAWMCRNFNITSIKSRRQ